MSDLRVNLSANVKRYTAKKNRAEYIAKLAAYTALSFILYAFCKFPLPFMFPGFLEIQISELPALIAGFSMGPISGCLVIVLKCLLKFPLSSTFFVGEATDILLGICFVLPSSLIYNAKKNKTTALISLIVGSICLTVMSIIVNRFISIPFYIEVMFGGKTEPLLNMLRSLYKSITMENFYNWYLGVGVLPFNLFRCIIVSLVTYLLYPRLQRPLRLEVTDIPTQAEKLSEDEPLATEVTAEVVNPDENSEEPAKVADEISEAAAEKNEDTAAQEVAKQKD